MRAHSVRDRSGREKSRCRRRGAPVYPSDDKCLSCGNDLLPPAEPAVAPPQPEPQKSAPPTAATGAAL